MLLTKILEIDRVLFIENRDGVEGAVAFCKQGLHVYRDALKRPTKEKPKGKYARGPDYHRPFVESLITFRWYLKSHGRYYGNV
jgi:hypothetical protein